MIDLSFTAAKSSFFDSEKVIASVDVATRQALSKMGAFVRTRARSSIRKRKKSSPPGSPPSSHRGELRRFLFFSFDPRTFSVVVGPTGLPSGSRSDPLNDLTVPRVLERGDPAVPREVEATASKTGRRAATRKQARAYRRLLRAGRLARPVVAKVVKTFVYRARPYMGPALHAEVAAGTITDQLRGSIRG